MARVSDKGPKLFDNSVSILNAPVQPPPKPVDSTLNFQGRPAPAPAPAPAPSTNPLPPQPGRPGQPDPPRPPGVQTRLHPHFAPYNVSHQDLWNRTNNIIQESLAREYEAEQRWVENKRLLEAREYDPSPSPTPSVATDDDYKPADFWHEDQVALNVILNARNEYSLMPSTWRISLRGIPLPEGLFYTKTRNTSSRPRIYAHTDKLEYRGTLLLFHHHLLSY